MLETLAQDIKKWGLELGFNAIGIADLDLSEHADHLKSWLAKGYHGEMGYMEAHGEKRTRPELLIPGTQRVIMARLDYLPPSADIRPILDDPTKGAISRYALGRDYHTLIRKRLDQLGQKIKDRVADTGYRAFADSGPVLEKALAEKAGLGWIGKNTLLLFKQGGSYFFLGTLFTNLPLPIDSPTTKHCGKCTACIDICPTQAIVAPYQLDARRCISYLTIELKTAIPIEFRRPMGNRIYGCDDCQVTCPWNKFAQFTQEKDFHPRHHLESPDLIELFKWTETVFLKRTEGSAIRRIGHERWLRNIAIALGNAPYNPQIIKALEDQQGHPSELVREHVEWAIEEQYLKNK